MVSLRLVCSLEERDELIATLWELGTLGVTEIDQPGGQVELRAFFDTTIESPALSGKGGHWEEEPEIDWAAESRAAWPGRAVGEKWFIVPPWNEEPTPEGRIRLVINPGVGFGTGRDLTTQLCLEGIERELKPDDVVFDFGTGSGILALAAYGMGARAVIAADIDEDAVRAARLDLPEEIGLYIGSVRSVRDSSIDLVLANLNAEAITNHAAEIRRVLRSGGRLIVSGVPPRHGDRVTKAIASNGLPPREVHEDGEWLRIVS